MEREILKDVEDPTGETNESAVNEKAVNDTSEDTAGGNQENMKQVHVLLQVKQCFMRFMQCSVGVALVDLCFCLFLNNFSPPWAIPS